MFELVWIAGENSIDIRCEKYFFHVEFLREEGDERVSRADGHSPRRVEDHIAMKHRDSADSEGIFYCIGRKRLERSFVIGGNRCGIDARDGEFTGLEYFRDAGGEELIESVVFKRPGKFFRCAFGSLREPVLMGMEVSEGSDAMDEDEAHFFRIVGTCEGMTDLCREYLAKFRLGGAFHRKDAATYFQDVCFHRYEITL